MFTGEPKAAVTVKGVPFTLVNCFDISVIEQKVKDTQSEPIKAVQPKPVQPLKIEAPVKPLKIEVAQEIKLLNTNSPELPTETKTIKNNDVNEADVMSHWRKYHTDVQYIKVAGSCIN